MLPPTDIQKAIITHPNTCPFCQSTLLDADSPTIDDDDNVRIAVTCTQCHSEWVEIYVLTSAILVEANNQCIFDEETCKSIDYRSVSGNRADDYASIPCDHYEECKKKVML